MTMLAGDAHGLGRGATGHSMPSFAIIIRVDGFYLTVNGKRALNLASTNFLGLGGTPEMIDVASRTVEKYGVGSCGPRGFYGTIDVHLEVWGRPR